MEPAMAEAMHSSTTIMATVMVIVMMAEMALMMSYMTLTVFVVKGYLSTTQGIQP
jgi:hypothetical protein